MTTFSTMNIRPASKAVLAGMNIAQPTPIQEATIPALLAGTDLIGQARTGSGKTLAFSLPLVERIDPALAAVQALVLVPTRELAIQVGHVVGKLAAAHHLRYVLIYGGCSLYPQKTALARGAQIVIGTPGRILDHIRQGNLSLDKVQYLVLDEADEMLGQGFAPDVERILRCTQPERQTALFSATIPEWVNTMAERHLSKPEWVMIDNSPEAAPAIEHIACEVPEGSKMNILRALLDDNKEGVTLVFGKTKHGVKRLGEKLANMGYPVAALQGNLSQNQREQIMRDFRSGKVRILVATNVAARGIDVSALDLVINYELPESAELLTHRIGRTGRMGRAGVAITLIGPEEQRKWQQLVRDFGKPFKRAVWNEATQRPDFIQPAPKPTLRIKRNRPAQKRHLQYSA